MIFKLAKPIIILVFCLFILSGCQNIFNPVSRVNDYITGKAQMEQKKQADKTLAIMKCQELCQNQISNDLKDFNLGPCLSEEIIPDWACDVAHSLRQDVDNEKGNQCAFFTQGKVSHFVEVDGNCNVLKSY
ncbi:MAG: hypothetical protein WCW26_05575 [Candidatus Buchananbacteria bacterium]